MWISAPASQRWGCIHTAQATFAFQSSKLISDQNFLTDVTVCFGSRRIEGFGFRTSSFEGSEFCLNTAQRNIHEGRMRIILIQSGLLHQRSLATLKFRPPLLPPDNPCINWDIRWILCMSGKNCEVFRAWILLHSNEVILSCEMVTGEFQMWPVNSVMYSDSSFSTYTTRVGTRGIQQL